MNAQRWSERMDVLLSLVLDIDPSMDEDSVAEKYDLVVTHVNDLVELARFEVLAESVNDPD